MIGEPDPGQEAAAPPDDPADDGVRLFAMGQVSLRPAARVAGIERMGERLSRHLRAAIEPIARVKTQVGAEPIRSARFEAWLNELPAFTSLSHYRVPPLKSGVLVMVEPDFVTRMVDAYYGGIGKPSKHRAREFTPTEDRLLARLTEAVVGALVSGWSEVAALEPILAARETNAAFASFVRRDETIVVQSFTVNPGTGKPTSLSIVYAAAALRPFEALFAAKVHGGDGDADPDWRRRLAGALENVRLPVRSVLARPEMTMSQLMQLKPGDVIPIVMPAKAPLIVADRRIASGTIGEREGKAALMIEEVFGGKQ
ncbi:MAG: flagellar motor switch protein FliM [Sphingomonas bacterium]|nr:flagellar motor switch protein FliM [Sphingomonas bacterium]